MRTRDAALRYVEERRRRGELNGASPQTYRDALIRFAVAAGDPDITKLRRKHVEMWLQASQACSAATTRTRFSVVRLFCRWGMEQGYYKVDPTKGVPIPRRVRLLPRALKAEQVTAVFGACTDNRDRVMVSLCMQEGLRVSEVARLEVGDLDLNDRLVFVRKGKGGHQRLLPLSDETAQAITAYLQEHPAGNGPLIRSYVRTSRALTAPHIGRLIINVMAAAGVHTRPRDGFTAHAGRHTVAHAVLAKTGDVRDVQAALGHVELATSMIYLRSTVDMDRLRTAMGGRQYRGAGAHGDARSGSGLGDRNVTG